MRTFLLWLLVSVSLVAQQPAGRGAGPAPTYKNLKLLAANLHSLSSKHHLPDKVLTRQNKSNGLTVHRNLPS